MEFWNEYPDPAHKEAYIHDIAFDLDGNLWAAMVGVVYRRKNGIWSKIYDSGTMIRLNSIAVAPDSTVWIAGGGSILSFDGENWTIHDDNIPAGN